MAVTSTVALEIARLVARRPSPEQVIAFQPSPESVERAYALIDAERNRTLTEDEHQELESFLVGASDDFSESRSPSDAPTRSILAWPRNVNSRIDFGFDKL